MNFTLLLPAQNMNLKTSISFIFFVVFFAQHSFGQLVPRHFKDTVYHATIIKFGYMLASSTSDLKNRFGVFNSANLSCTYKTNKNWLWGAQFDFLFGNQVKEKDMLRNIATPDGFIIGSDGLLIDPSYNMRGFITSIYAGKIFPVGYNQNSGISVSSGLGLMQHKVLITLERNTSSYALDKELTRGYDRLSNGLLWHNSVGYTHLSNRGLINFFGSIDFGFAATQNRRSFNYDTGLKDQTKRFDGFWGVKVGFILPLYPKTTPEFYYN